MPDGAAPVAKSLVWDMPPPPLAGSSKRAIDAAFDARGGWVVNRLQGDLTGVLPIHAAGVVGNLGGESGLMAVQEVNPIAGKGGWGWEQATGDRRVSFDQFCTEQGFTDDEDEANYDFLVKELLSSESHALAQLKKTTTLEAATYTFEVLFERPSDPQGGIAARVAYARRALAASQKTPSGMPSTLVIPRAPGASQASPDPQIELLRPQASLLVGPSAGAAATVTPMGTAATVGGASVPAVTLVKTAVALGLALPPDLQTLWIATLMMFGGWAIHSAIISAARKRILKDLDGS
jgi:hypothetical protein